MDGEYEKLQAYLDSGTNVGNKQDKFVPDKKFDIEFFKKIAPRCFTLVDGGAWTFELKGIDLDKLDELLSLGLFNKVPTSFINVPRMTQDRKLLFTLFEQYNIDKKFLNHVRCHKNNLYSIKLVHLSLKKVLEIKDMLEC